MENKEYAALIRLAVAGDRYAFEAVIERFMPLVNSKSVRKGKLDEDLRQYILMCIVVKWPSFRIR